MAELIWTRFPDRTAATATERRMEWADLVRYLADPGEFPAKAACPWLKLAQFGPHRSARGSLRHDGNVLGVYGVEGDYDGEVVQPSEAIEALERAGIKACVYTSPSHTPDAPRWRVLAPLATPHAPGDRSHILARINGVLGGILTAESFTLSQSYYFGRVRGVHYQVLATWDDPDEGNYVDQLDDLDAVAINRAPVQHSGDGAGRTTISEVVERLGRRLRTGDERRALLKSYIGAKAARGLCDDEIRALVDDQVTRFFDPSDAVDWSDINGLIRSITESEQAHQAEVRATVGGFVRRLGEKADAPSATRQFKLRRAKANFAELRPVKWAITGYVAAGEVVVWAGQPGVGKSTVFTALALLVAGYGPVMGSDIEVDRQRRVVVITENAEQYERLIYAFCQRYAIDPSEAEQRISLVDSHRLNVHEIEAELMEQVRQNTGDEPPLVIMDTASSSFDVKDENSNAEIGGMLAAIKGPAVSTGSPLWVVSHAAKALGREDSEITPRGASAYIGDVHGTGSVFQDKNCPGSTFLRSLKNRHERAFAEIEVRTEVMWHEATDDRGVIQRIGLRIGVPMRATDTRARAATDAANGAESANNILRSNKAKSASLSGAIISMLSAAKHKTLRNIDIATMLMADGFGRSTIYRAIDQLDKQGVLTRVNDRVHLNGHGPANEAGEGA